MIFPILLAEAFNKNAKTQENNQPGFVFFGEDLSTGKNILHYLCESNGLGMIKIAVNQAPFLTMMTDNNLKLPEQYIDRSFQLSLKTVTCMFRFAYLMSLQRNRVTEVDVELGRYDLDTYLSLKQSISFKSMPDNKQLLDLSASSALRWAAAFEEQKKIVNSFKSHDFLKLQNFMRQLKMYQHFRQRLALLESMITTLDDPTLASTLDKHLLYQEDFVRLKKIIDVLSPLCHALALLCSKFRSNPDLHEEQKKEILHLFVGSLNKNLIRLVDFIMANMSARLVAHLPRICQLILECKELLDPAIVRDLCVKLMHRKFALGESIVVSARSSVVYIADCF